MNKPGSSREPFPEETEPAVGTAATVAEAAEFEDTPEDLEFDGDDGLEDFAASLVATNVAPAAGFRAGVRRDLEDELNEGEAPGEFGFVGQVHADSPEAAHALAKLAESRMLKRLQHEQEAQRAEVIMAKAEGRRPRKLYDTPVLTLDESTIRLSDGEKGGEKGYITRWVRIKNDQGQKLTSRYHLMAARGYRPILDAATGKPIISAYGIAMQIHPTKFGEMQAVLKHQQQVGQVEKGLRSAQDFVEDNRYERYGFRGGKDMSNARTVKGDPFNEGVG